MLHADDIGILKIVSSKIMAKYETDYAAFRMIWISTVLTGEQDIL